MSNHIGDFSIPNIDCLSDDDLNDVMEVIGTIGDYCIELSIARRLRKQGKIDEAVATEEILDGIYDCLPEWAKW